MIELKNEVLLTIAEAAKLLPGAGKRAHVHASTVWRWALKGVRGFMLETIRLGGKTYTSLEAMQRFAKVRSAASAEDSTTSLSTPKGDLDTLRQAGLVSEDRGADDE